MILKTRFSGGVVSASLAATLILTACGGGGDAAVASPGASAAATTVGSISGFGSIIVNGVRFEDNAARITDDSDNSMSASALGLGMTVEVRGSVNDDGSGSASSCSMRLCSRVCAFQEQALRSSGKPSCRALSSLLTLGLKR